MSTDSPREGAQSSELGSSFREDTDGSPLTQQEKSSLAVLVGLLAIAALFGALGCMSSPRIEAVLSPSDPPIQVEYKNNLSTLRPGMSRSRVEWNMRGTSLRLAGRTECEGGHIDAYELSKERTMASGQKRTEYLWFYFKDDALIRWGPPGDWPVIESGGASPDATFTAPK